MSDSVILAGRVRRFFAGLIDFIAVPLVSILVMLVTGILEHAEAYSSFFQTGMRATIVAVLGYLVTNGWLLYRRGQTLGKAIMGIMIVDVDSGEKASFRKLILARMWFLATLYLLLVPWLLLIPLIDHVFIFSKQRRCLHDLICGTSVVTRP